MHKDDFNVYVNGKLIGTYGSQGQNRTAVLSLKMSELEIFNDEVSEYPILLLDDFMSELDSNRRNNLLKFIDDIQVIITCTDKLNDKEISAKYFKVEKGKINKE